MELFLDLESYKGDLTDQQKAYREAGITAPGNYKDPEKIKQAIEEKKQSLYDKDALDPLYGRIICIGFMITDMDEVIKSPTVIIDTDEKVLLVEFYKALGVMDEPSGAIYPITFNGTTFDIPYINFRTMKHGITSHYRLQSLPENDLKNLMAQQMVKTPEHTLDEYAMAFGIDYFSGVSGKDIGGLWESEQYDMIAQHCSSDVSVAFRLYQIARGYHFTIGRRAF